MLKCIYCLSSFWHLKKGVFVMCLAFKISFQVFFCKLSIFCEDMNKECTLKLYHDIHMGDWQKENLFLWTTINMDMVYGRVFTAKNDFESLVFDSKKSLLSNIYRVFISEIFQSCLTFTKSYCVELFRCHNRRKFFQEVITIKTIVSLILCLFVCFQ